MNPTNLPPCVDLSEWASWSESTRELYTERDAQGVVVQNMSEQDSHVVAVAEARCAHAAEMDAAASI